MNPKFIASLITEEPDVFNEAPTPKFAKDLRSLAQKILKQKNPKKAEELIQIYADKLRESGHEEDANFITRLLALNTRFAIQWLAGKNRLRIAQSIFLTFADSKLTAYRALLDYIQEQFPGHFTDEDVQAVQLMFKYNDNGAHAIFNIYSREPRGLTVAIAMAEFEEAIYDAHPAAHPESDATDDERQRAGEKITRELNQIENYLERYNNLFGNPRSGGIGSRTADYTPFPVRRRRTFRRV